MDFSPTLVARFWRYVDCSAGLYACWPWTGYTTRRRGRKGRRNRAGAREGRISNIAGGRRRMLRATRVALALSTGEWHEELEACHTCENPLCCNPAHLYWGDHQRNMGDMVEAHGGVGKHGPREGESGV
jgi:hypothetical protein